jgi:hypothetical protein
MHAVDYGEIAAIAIEAHTRGIQLSREARTEARTGLLTSATASERCSMSISLL